MPTRFLGRSLFKRKDIFEMVHLEHAPTSALMCELVKRAIRHGDKDASPHSLLRLSCLMASVLGTRQSFLFAEELRDAADQLENPERVRV